MSELLEVDELIATGAMAVDDVGNRIASIVLACVKDGVDVNAANEIAVWSVSWTYRRSEVFVIVRIYRKIIVNHLLF